MTSMARISLGAALLSLLILPGGSLSGQSVLGAQGLGTPLEPMDARARGLGSVGTGLFGGTLSPLDPASATGLLIPTLNMTLQPFWGSGNRDDESLNGQGTRFPLLGLAYPVAALQGMITLTFGGYMDQRWEAEVQGTQELGGISTPVTNTYRSEGGISSLTLGWAQRFGPRLSLSVGAGYHTGSVTRTFFRSFDSLTVGTSPVSGYRDGGKWQYGGPTGSLGAVWDPVDFLRVSGSMTWNGDLDAEPTDETGGRAATFRLPTEYRIGASGVLTPDLTLSMGVAYADWSPSSGGLSAEEVVDGAWTYGGGLEWEVIRLGSRTFPLRLGMRRSTLPFLLDGAEPRESLVSAGLGLNLSQAEAFILAGVDLALERGTREAGSFSEDFYRGTLTVRVSGW
ncbi:MAG: hypothetical protein R6T96_10410 [Longimicrobiales bacterium]